MLNRFAHVYLCIYNIIFLIPRDWQFLWLQDKFRRHVSNWFNLQYTHTYTYIPIRFAVHTRLFLKCSTFSFFSCKSVKVRLNQHKTETPCLWLALYIYNIPVYIVAQDIIVQYFTPLPPTHTQTSARVLFFSYIPISFFLPIPIYTVQVLRRVIII